MGTTKKPFLDKIHNFFHITTNKNKTLTNNIPPNILSPIVTNNINNNNNNNTNIALNNNIPPKILSTIIPTNVNNNLQDPSEFRPPTTPQMAAAAAGNNIPQLIVSSQVEVMQIMDNKNSNNNGVIELNDDHDDDECVFVKKERNFTPIGKNKTDPICVDKYVDVECYDFGVSTPEKKDGDDDHKGKITKIPMDVDVDVDVDVEGYDFWFTTPKKKDDHKGKIPMDVDVDVESYDFWFKKNDHKGKIVIDEGVQCVDSDNDDCCVVKEMPSFRKRIKPFRNPSVTEKGESSKSKMKGKVMMMDYDEDVVVEVDPASIVFSTERRRVRKSVSVSMEDEVVEVNPATISFTCEICADDTKTMIEAFRVKGCSHSYCSDCVRSYVGSKLEEGVSTIGCPVPRCTGVLDPEYCREILPVVMFDRWGMLLCESVILASQKFYCPFKECSALLIDDGSENIVQCECPVCFRMFCAKCTVAWHQGVSCEEYQKLGKDERSMEDLMLRNLAKNQKWQRCPSCKFIVERTQGCLYMRCRCGVAFCYNCGEINHDHTGHNCKKCGR